MIETKVTKMIEVSYGKEENEILDKAAAILMDIVDTCYREGFSNGVVENTSETISCDVYDVEELAHILEKLADSNILTIKD